MCVAEHIAWHDLIFVTFWHKICGFLKIDGTQKAFFWISFYSLRTLLHKSSTPSSVAQRSPNADSEQIRVAKSLVRKVFEDSLKKLEIEPSRNSKPIRWELGACWVQHLQNQASSKSESKKTEDAKPEPAVKGLGKQGALLKEIKRKIDVKANKTEQGKEDTDNKSETKDQKELEKQNEEMEKMWKELVTETAYQRLKESETGFHLKVCLFL